MSKDTPCKRRTRQGFRIAGSVCNCTYYIILFIITLALIATILVMPGYWITHAKSNHDILGGSIFYGIFVTVSLFILIVSLYEWSHDINESSPTEEP